MKKYSKAFTLIELLVVIAIIGILAGMILVSVGKARAKARDTQRKNDLAQMQKALAMYYADNESYPVDYADLSKLVPIYIKAIPTDPSGGLYSYTPSPSGCTGTGCSAFTISTPNPLETDTTHTWEVTESSASAVVAGNSNANSGNGNTNSGATGIAIDTTESASANGLGATWSFEMPVTVANASNRVLIIGLYSYNGQVSLSTTHNAPTFNGSALTNIGFKQFSLTTAKSNISYWYLINPPIGTNNAILSGSTPGATDNLITAESQAIVLDNVDAASAGITTASATKEIMSQTMSLPITIPTANAWVVDFVAQSFPDHGFIPNGSQNLLLSSSSIASSYRQVVSPISDFLAWGSTSASKWGIIAAVWNPAL